VSGPAASILIPVYNEAEHISEVLDRLNRQTEQDFEAIFADGRSSDTTREIIAQAAKSDHRLRLVDNPKRVQSAGLNAALHLSTAKYVIRLDGHAYVPDDYVARCIELLATTGASVVGGRMVPRTAHARVPAAIGLANRSWWGAGPARFHRGGEPGPAETVYLGSFLRSRLMEVDGWDETLAINEDFELNHRLRKAGGVVFLDPGLEVEYTPRSTFRSLARQYFRYGRSKPVVMRRHPGSIKIRQLAPAMLAPAIAGSAIVGRWGPLAAIGTLYGLLVAVASDDRTPPHRFMRPTAAAAALTMHLSWSSGFWYGAVRPMPAPEPVSE